MMILVFRTSIRSKKQAGLIGPLLASISGIKRWTIDLQDRDRVLRLEVAGVSPHQVEELVSQEGFLCRELEG